MITELVQKEGSSGGERQGYVAQLYDKVAQEILHNSGKPVSRVTFGTSGWRGILGKDLFRKSVAQVILAIVEMYESLGENKELAAALGVADMDEVRRRGCVVGYDNRFCGDVLAKVAVDVLAAEDIKVFFAGETTTGVISACILQLNAAFSINFTPSHNPLEYGGLKFNAADGGPAATEITQFITERARRIIEDNRIPSSFHEGAVMAQAMGERVEYIDSLSLWKRHVRRNYDKHGLDFDRIIEGFEKNEDFVVVIDSVHGASRLHIDSIFKETNSPRLLHLRKEEDVTFGGVAPEPSSENMRKVVTTLKSRAEKYKLGAIIDPDGDRIRFTDGNIEISMNQFGAMAYHFLHEWKKKRGLIAKTVASSNLANSIAAKLGEDVFEPKVGFKEFKPVIGKALVCFEESDGISIIGHTPEKDAYIGLLLALDMVVTTGKNIGEYLHQIEETYGFFYPERDGIAVSLQGEELLTALAGLEKYSEGNFVEIDGEKKTIDRVIDIDGRKMILSDGSWLMIRPSGTEPKVRFYVESRTADGTAGLVRAAKGMLAEIGLI
jgi:phosphomannomutase